VLRERTRYHLRKLHSAWASGTMREKVVRKVSMSVYVPFRVLRDYVQLAAPDRTLLIDEGFADHRARPDFLHATTEAVQRVMEAYCRAKADEPLMPAAMRVRGLWKEWIAVNYGPLIAALVGRDVDRLKELLDNFNREQFAVGTGAGYDDHVRYRLSAIARPYLGSVWCGYRDQLLSRGIGVDEVNYPLVGNPAGVKLGDRVVPIETLRHAYNAAGMVELLQGIEHPAVLEIGGGFGGQAYQTYSRAKRGKYMIFDIPEVAAVCSYFLLMAFPGKRIRLYGEGDVSAAPGEEYDIGVFPHYAIPAVEDRSVDLVFNSHSFAEMDGTTVRAYMDVVNRVCRRYFMHINHETRLTFQDPLSGDSSNLLGSEVVPDAGFRLLDQRPYSVTRPEDRPFTVNSYLYERASGGLSGRAGGSG
jgi:putative sugar O-methyltransferase